MDTSLYTATRSLCLVISEDRDDYPDDSAYRQMMDRLKIVQDELAVIEECNRVSEARKELITKQYKKADEAWMDFDLGYDDEDDVHIESNGWSSDGNHYSRTYYVSVNGDESTAHCFSVEFEDGTTNVL